MDVWAIHDFVPDYRAFTSGKTWMPGDPAMPGGPSGCGFYRITLPLDELNRDGWDCRYAHGKPPKEADAARIMVGQRLDKYEALPEWRRMRARHRLVYEIDDDVFSIEPVNWMAHQVYRKADVQDAVAHSAQVADLVTVTTEPLAEIMRQHNPEVRVVPNCIPDGILTMARNRSGRKRVTIGWVGGASHGADLAMIAGPLRSALDSCKRAELHIMGTDFRPTVDRGGRFTPWMPADASLAYYRGIDFDIALAPLTGTVFDQSKSSIKALEAFGLGIPVIASDCEPYRGVVIDGVNGYLCRTEADWERRITELANDDAAREAMGAKARESALGHTISKGAERWASAYRELL